jgi:hypothetical protein
MTTNERDVVVSTKFLLKILFLISNRPRIFLPDCNERLTLANESQLVSK